MEDVNVDPALDAISDLITAFITSVLIVIFDKVTWAIWNTIVNFLSVDHMGNSAAIVVLTLGTIGCIYFYVMKFMAD